MSPSIHTFALAAMKEMLANPRWTVRLKAAATKAAANATEAEILAQMAYAFAEAMIKEGRKYNEH